MQTILDLRAVVQAVGDAVVGCDEKGAITLWNPAAERIFGFSQAEALGASLDIIIPERMRKRHWDGYHETMRTGITRYGNDVLRVPAINKAGGALSISFTVAMLFSPDHKVSSILAVMRDETARFNEDRAQRKKLAELEALVRDKGLAATDTPPVVQTTALEGGCPFAGTAAP
jgi:PAS domain S-box-containing protein